MAWFFTEGTFRVYLATAIEESAKRIFNDPSRKSETFKTVEEAEQIYSNFEKMLDEQEYNAEILEEAIVYDDVYKQPNRKKCALLPWWGIDKIISKK